MKRMVLKNRYSIRVWLEEIGENTWQLKTPGIYSVRTGYSEDNLKNIIFIDPEGGPYMSVGKFSGIASIKFELIDENEGNTLENTKTIFVINDINTFRQKYVVTELE